LEVDLTAGVVRDLTAHRRYRATKMPQVMVDILAAGGLVAYLQKHRDFVSDLT
jgi:hypothetical protein